MKLFFKVFFYTLLFTTTTFKAWGADPEPEMTPAPAVAQLNFNKPISQVDNLLSYAKKFRGVPYRHGASGPRGFDCSGFTSYVYKEFGYKLNRTASGQFSNGTQVNRGELKPGDLVFFGGRGGGRRIGHVGIVTKVDDNGQGFTFIHASCSKGITENHSSESYYRVRYRNACRVFKDNTPPEIQINMMGIDLAQFTADRVSD
jgi:cell wall-associated NlpC family hydrolase